MIEDFSDVGMGPGVRPLNQVAGQLLPEQQDHGVGAVYDRARRAGATHEQAEEEVRKSVYGVNYKRDKKGAPIGVGVGSPGNESIGHFQAIRKYQGEVRYQAALKEIWSRDPARARKIGLEEPARSSA